MRENSRALEYFKTRVEMLNQKGVPSWMRIDPNAFSGRILAVPTRQDLQLPFDEALVVEYYQRWAASGDPEAPAYRKISGTGSVDEITARALAALA